jgi:hypothetical protein
MPRILRRPRSKSFRLENVSVPNADGARYGRRRHPERTQSEVRLGSQAAVWPRARNVRSGPDYGRAERRLHLRLWATTGRQGRCLIRAAAPRAVFWGKPTFETRLSLARKSRRCSLGNSQPRRPISLGTPPTAAPTSRRATLCGASTEQHYICEIHGTKRLISLSLTIGRRR